MENTVFTVTQINNQLNSILKKHFKKIFIEGEISLFKVYPSGHAYFTLRDNNSEISCVYFNYTRNSSNISLENTKVILSADLSPTTLANRVLHFPSSGFRVKIIRAHLVIILKVFFDKL